MAYIPLQFDIDFSEDPVLLCQLPESEDNMKELVDDYRLTVEALKHRNDTVSAEREQLLEALAKAHEAIATHQERIGTLSREKLVLEKENKKLRRDLFVLKHIVGKARQAIEKLLARRAGMEEKIQANTRNGESSTIWDGSLMT